MSTGAGCGLSYAVVRDDVNDEHPVKTSDSPTATTGHEPNPTPRDRLMRTWQRGSSQRRQSRANATQCAASYAASTASGTRPREET